jgi:hypothetical protein
VNLSEVTHRADDAAAATTAAAVVAAATTAAATLETVESFGIGYGQGAGESTGNWMKPPGNLFLYPTLDMKDLTGSVEDMVLLSLSFASISLFRRRCRRRRRRRAERRARPDVVRHLETAPASSRRSRPLRAVASCRRRRRRLARLGLA